MFVAAGAFVFGGCTTMGKLSQVVGGAYNAGGQVLIDKGKEDEAKEKQEKAKPAADQPKQVAAQSDDSSVKPATKLPAKKKAAKKKQPVQSTQTVQEDK